MRVPELARWYCGAFGVTVGLSIGACMLARHLIVNCTGSMPLGLYWLSRGRLPGLGDLVAFPIPKDVRSLVRERRYLPDGALLLKEVVAVPGDRVCTEEGLFSINHRPFGAMRSSDSVGRPLPCLMYCGPVAAGDLYVASHAFGSFDSRSFGPVRTLDIRGTVSPIWTF
jgi:conjugative transfer signal peptidase TraF